jgi:hypothetical protein
MSFYPKDTERGRRIGCEHRSLGAIIAFTRVECMAAEETVKE